MKWPTTRCDWALLHQRTLYSFDARERMCAVRDPAAGEAPGFHFVRTLHGNVWRFHRDLEEASCKALARLAAREGPLSAGAPPWPPPQRLAAMLSVLGESDPSPTLWRGPLYHFAPAGGEALRQDGPAGSLLSIEPADREAVARLASVLPTLAAEIVERQPCLAALANGAVASVCCSATDPSGPAIEASVQTLPGHRGSGLAGACVAGWAASVYAKGKIPLYSTTWRNRASRSVARKLDLQLYGESLHAMQPGGA
ncbi:MAG: GNAT family N-acetyltransferase [Myxococcota bacterium]